MESIKKKIPLWIKAPLTVLQQQIGKLPVNMVLSHVFRAWAESTACPEETRWKACKLVQQTTMGYLEKHYSEHVGMLVPDPQPGVRPEKPTIWVFWWQGETAAPEIVKRCIASIRKQAGGHPVQLITEENYLEFADVAEHVEQKRKEKTISLTHFSDYYRMALLEKQGGIWVDASIFACGKIPDEIFNMPIFTMRNPGMDTTNISNWEWTVGVIGGWKGNTLFSVCRSLLEAYWEEHNSLVDYFVFDYFIRLAYEACPMIREQIVSIPPNNPDFYYLQQHAEEPWEDTVSLPMGEGDTWLYKLSWKKEYAVKTPDRRPTVYAHWMQETGGSR